MTSSSQFSIIADKQRNINRQKKARLDHIFMIQQNLKMMRNEADEFLKKGNKQLPPITQARHYLYLNFMQKNIEISNLINEERSSLFKEPEPNGLKNYSTLNPRKVPKTNKYFHKSLSIVSNESTNEESVIVIKKQSVLNNPEKNQMSVGSIQPSEFSKTKRQLKNSKTPSIINFECNVEQKKSKKNKFNELTQKHQCMRKLKQTHLISGNILKNMTFENQIKLKPRYQKSKINIQSIQNLFVFPQTTKSKQNSLQQDLKGSKSSKGAQISNDKQNLVEQVIKQKQINQKITIQHQQIAQKSQYMFSKRKGVDAYQLLSSDAIDIERQKLGFKDQLAQSEQITKQFNPLRSTLLTKQHEDNETLNRSCLSYSHQIPRAIQSLPPKFKNRWIHQFQNQFQHQINSDRTENHNKFSDDRQLSKSHLLVKRRSLNINKDFLSKPVSKIANNTSSLKKNKEDLSEWEPWKLQQQRQNFDLQNGLQI